MHSTPRFILPNSTSPVIDLVGNNANAISLCDTNMPGYFIAAEKSATGSTAVPSTSDEANRLQIRMIHLPEYLYVETKFISATVAKKYNLLDNNKRGEQNKQLNNNCNSNNQPRIAMNVRPRLPVNISITPAQSLTTSHQRSGTVMKPVRLSNNINNQMLCQNDVAVCKTAITTTTDPLNARMPFNNVNTLQTPFNQINNCNTTVVTLPIKNHPQFDTRAKTSMAQTSRPMTPSLPTELTAQCVTAMKKDAETMTDNNAPTVDRCQQTDNEMPTTETIAIQCNRYEEKDCEDSNVSGNENESNDVEFVNDVESAEKNAPHMIQNIQDDDANDEENNFRQFLINSSSQYNNGLRECLICGEVMKWDKHFMAHMSVHWGPKVLCYKCGQVLQHETLLAKHCCAPCHWHITKKKSLSQLLRCPYYRCSVVAISPIELYNHINEHNNFKTYSCSQCSKMFHTYEELNHHKHLRIKCYMKSTAVNSIRAKYSFHGKYSKKCRKCRSRVHIIYKLAGGKVLVRKRLMRNDCICQICLKACRNRVLLKCHMNKCYNWYNKRLTSKTLRCLTEF